MVFAHPYFSVAAVASAPARLAEGAGGAAGVPCICLGVLSPVFTRALLFSAPVPFWQRCAAGVLAAFIMASGQLCWLKSTTTVKASGIDIVCACSPCSGSTDFGVYSRAGRGVNRFNMARSVLKSFIDARPSHRAGGVRGPGVHRCAVDVDHDYLQENLDRLEIGTINSDATAIGDAQPRPSTGCAT